MRRLLGVAALIGPCALLFAAFMLAGCSATRADINTVASAVELERTRRLAFQYAVADDLAAMDKATRARLEEVEARLQYLEKVRPQPVDECEQAKDTRACRNRKQDEAFDRIVKRGLKVSTSCSVLHTDEKGNVVPCPLLEKR